MMKLKKSEKLAAETFILNVFGTTFPVTVLVVSALEHRIALEFIAKGEAVAVSKKNYGRIASIKRVA